MNRCSKSAMRPARRRARCMAMLVPMTPPPTMTTSAVRGTPPPTAPPSVIELPVDEHVVEAALDVGAAGRRRIPRRLARALAGGQALDDGVVVRIEEDRHGEALPARAIHD